MEQAGSGGKTETLLRDALRACPNHVVTLNNLALLLGDAGRLKEAETYYRRTTVADPKSPAPWAGIGRCSYLRSHHAISVVEEIPTMEKVQDALGRLPGGHPDGLAEIKPNHLAELRQIYFEELDKHLAPEDRSSIRYHAWKGP